MRVVWTQTLTDEGLIPRVGRRPLAAFPVHSLRKVVAATQEGIFVWGGIRDSPSAGATVVDLRASLELLKGGGWSPVEGLIAALGGVPRAMLANGVPQTRVAVQPILPFGTT